MTPTVTGTTPTLSAVTRFFEMSTSRRSANLHVAELGTDGEHWVRSLRWFFVC